MLVNSFIIVVTMNTAAHCIQLRRRRHHRPWYYIGIMNDGINVVVVVAAVA